MAVATADLRNVVIDSGPLISVLLVQFAFESEDLRRRQAIFSRSRVAAYLAGDSRRQRAAIELSNFFQHISTTSHVLGELRGLDTLTGPDKIAFWTNSINWLHLKGLDEQLVQLLTIHAEPKLRKPLVELGHVDVGLTQLARQLGATLITDDSGLFAFAPSQTVRCVHFRDLISDSLET